MMSGSLAFVVLVGLPCSLAEAQAVGHGGAAGAGASVLPHGVGRFGAFGGGGVGGFGGGFGAVGGYGSLGYNNPMMGYGYGYGYGYGNAFANPMMPGNGFGANAYNPMNQGFGFGTNINPMNQGNNNAQGKGAMNALIPTNAVPPGFNNPDPAVAKAQPAKGSKAAKAAKAAKVRAAKAASTSKKR